MPGGRGKAKRSCPMCKPYKFAGNSTGGYDGRYKPKEAAKRKAMKEEAQRWV